MREEKKKDHAELWQEFFINAQEAILIADEAGVIIDVNPAFTRTTGYSRDEVIGKSTKILKSGYQDEKFYKSFWRSLIETGRWQGEIWNRKKNGDVYPEYLAISSIKRGEKVEFYLAIFYDISFLNEQSGRFRYLAHHDVLTGLPNRLALEVTLPQALARARRQGTLLVVGMIDIDDFKPVNDTYGHQVGDELLKAFAQRLRGSVRATDMVARLGGDEFVILLENLVLESEIETCLDRVGQVCATPFVLEKGVECKVGISLGFVLYPDDDPENSGSADLLLRKADMALYAAKANKGDLDAWRHRWGRSTKTQILALAQTPTGYGSPCARLLRLGSSALVEAARDFVDAFYGSLDQIEDLKNILSMLSEKEMAHLKNRQAEHLTWLLDPALDIKTHEQKARSIGQIHALVGVNASMMVKAMAIYQQKLVDRIISLPIRVADRASLVQVINIRLENELTAETAAMEKLYSDYRSWLLECSRADQSLKDFDEYVVACVNGLLNMPGVAAAAWGCADDKGQSIIRYAGGKFVDYINKMKNSNHDIGVIFGDDYQGNSTAARAWAKKEIVVNSSYIKNQHDARWREIAWSVGIRSSAAVPVVKSGKTYGVVTVYGRYPGQFESGFMRDILSMFCHILNLAAMRFSSMI